MPGPLTYAAVTLLARDRLGQIRRALKAKSDAGNARELDLHLLHLATEAEAMMNASQPVISAPMRLYGPPLTEHVSRFTLLGAIGPDLPRYAEYFAPGQRWLFDTLHKGTPDEHRERVLVNSTTLVFDFWNRVGAFIDADIPDQAKRLEAKKKMQAYALGHLCHIATDVLAHPYFESLESRLIDPAANVTRVMQRDDVAGAFDVRIADQFFARGTDTHNKKWADWFPTPSDVPDAFAKAMAASIASLYGARAEGLPAFEEAFKKISPAPTPLSADLIKESISHFRNTIEVERVWGFHDWLGTTWGMFLPIALAPFGTFVLPLGKDLSVALTGDAEKQRNYEITTYSLAVSALGPLLTMIIISASGRGLRAEGVTGWIHAFLSVAAAIGFFATLGGAGSLRWGVWFWGPIGLGVLQILFVILRGTRENSRKLLVMGPLMQVVLALIFLLFYRGLVHTPTENLPKDAADHETLKVVEDLGELLLWLLFVGLCWFGFAKAAQWAFSSSMPDDKNEFANGEPRQFLALYDDVSLIHDLSKPFDSEHLADLAYPPARRPIVKFWWIPVGNSTAEVVVRQDRLDFTFPNSAGVAPRTVFAPLAPITIEHWAALLATSVTRDGAIGVLQAKPARDDEKGIELSTGSLFSDNGDDKTKQVDHDAAAIVPVLVARTEDTASVLFHAPRPRLAERMGRDSVASDSARREQTATGHQLLPVAANPLQYHANDAADGTPPFLRRLFNPGDVIEIASTPPQQRIIVQVLGVDPAAAPPRLDQTDVIVSSPFPGGVFTAGALAYKRAASTRNIALKVTSPGQIPRLALGIGPNDIQAVAPIPFGAQLMVGDVVELQPPIASVQVPPTGARLLPERRVVVAVKDGALIGPAPGVATNLLELDAPPTPFLGPVVINRVSDAEAAGFRMVADASDVFGDGGSAMNDAADLAALLCMGAATRLTLNDTPVKPDGATRPVHRVYQVFRNWNLDRRRVNEWKTMVSGGAESERRGDYRAAEEASPVDRADAGETFSDAFIAGRRAAEATVLERGWLGVFRSWVDMTSRARTDSTATEVFRPGEPTNLDLSRAMAYLIDATEGVVP
jgi:hypothetical protein